jgi:hypothetical protein
MPEHHLAEDEHDAGAVDTLNYPKNLVQPVGCGHSLVHARSDDRVDGGQQVRVDCRKKHKGRFRVALLKYS